MALLPTKQRDQIMVLVVLLALGAIGLFWYFVYDPKSTELDHLAAHIDSLDVANQKAKSELAKGTVEEVREEARRKGVTSPMMHRPSAPESDPELFWI